MICNKQRLYWTILFSVCVLWLIFVGQTIKDYESQIMANLPLQGALILPTTNSSSNVVKTKLDPIQPQIKEVQKEIRDYIVQIAQKHNLGQKFIDVAECESGFIPQQSKIWHNGQRENSWGVWQINLDWHPEVLKAQAMDVIWSTNWAKDKWLEGKANLWACYIKNY